MQGRSQLWPLPFHNFSEFRPSVIQRFPCCKCKIKFVTRCQPASDAAVSSFAFAWSMVRCSFFIPNLVEMFTRTLSNEELHRKLLLLAAPLQSQGIIFAGLNDVWAMFKAKGLGIQCALAEMGNHHPCELCRPHTDTQTHTRTHSHSTSFASRGDS